MSTRRFFVLDDTVPSSEIPHMMCRVVEDKLRPLDHYAPSKRGSPTSPPQNPADIIPDILPEPFVRKVSRDQLSVAKQQGIGAALGAFFEFRKSHANQEGVELHTEEVKQYSLSNANDYWDELMENERYQADVKKFLLTVKRRRGYLITGFLTTSQALWIRTTGKSSEESLTATLPVDLALEAAAIPVPPGLTNPSISPNQETEMNREREMLIGDNEIFAVSYSPVKVQRWDKNIVIGGGIKAKKHELAFGKKDEEAETMDISEVDMSKVDVDIGDYEDEADEEDGEDGDTGAKDDKGSFFKFNDE